MRSKTLKFKVVFYLTIALSLAMVLFTALVVRHQRAELLRNAVEHVAQISDVIKKSTRFAMLANQPAYVDSIIRDLIQRQQVRPEGSLGEALADLCGCLSGSKDLSTRPLKVMSYSSG